MTTGRLDRWIGRHPFATFVAVAYAVSWSLWGISLAGGGQVPFLMGVAGPPVAALVVLWRTGGSLRWWAYALGLPALLYAVVSLVLQVVGSPVDWGLALDRAPAYAATWLFVLVLGGAMGGPGWRGFGLPHLLESHTPVRATLLVGLVWGLWHVPIYGPLGFVVPTLLAFFYTYLWARTRSVLLCIVLHASFTPAQDHLILMARDEAYSTALDTPDLVILAVYVVAAALLVLVTRGRLGVTDVPEGQPVTHRLEEPAHDHDLDHHRHHRRPTPCNGTVSPTEEGPPGAGRGRGARPPRSRSAGCPATASTGRCSRPRAR